MHEVLGDQAAQEAVRARNPGGKHCQDLLVSSNACLGCKHNPFKDVDSDARVARDNATITQWAVELGEYASMGVLPSFEYISPVEAVAARMAFQIRKYEDYEALAQIIAAKLGEVIAGMFGAK